MMNVSEFAGMFPANGGEEKMNSPLAYTIAEACAAARAGRTARLSSNRNSGELRAVKRGRRTLILKDDLVRWLRKPSRH